MLRLVRRARQRRADPELYAGLVQRAAIAACSVASRAADAQARRLDPQIATSVAQTYWMLGEFEKAIEGFGHGFFDGLPLVSLGRHEEGNGRDRTRIGGDSRRHHPRVPAHPAVAAEGEAQECLELLDALAPRNPDPESIFHIARTYARLGATDAGAAQFARAVDSGFFCATTSSVTRGSIRCVNIRAS
jgi:tetratricopeptide (TPR) repeat protein